MKLILIISIILIFTSCNKSTKNDDFEDPEPQEKLVDTVLIKIENKIKKSYEVGLYQKSFTYCWVVENDTLDFKIYLAEWIEDSSVHLNLFHRNPILLSDALSKINESLPLIEQDFNMDNLSSIYIKSPIFYKDVTIELTASYENQFGNNHINYQKLNDFLMNSTLQNRITAFLNQFNKSIKRYSIEKFHLLMKNNYDEYIPNTNLNDYPLFSIHGMGIEILLKDE